MYGQRDFASVDVYLHRADTLHLQEMGGRILYSGIKQKTK
jgi:hypothetical protein